MPQSKSNPITQAFRVCRIIFEFVAMAIKSVPSWRFPERGEGLDGDVRHLCQIRFQLISAICHVLR